MTENIAIITGYGSLTDEVLALARGLPGGYCRYMIKPWLPRLQNFAGMFNDRFGKSKEITPVNPFHFSSVQHALVANKITCAYFTGDFPRDRYLQIYINRALGILDKIGDEKCIRYFNETDKTLSQPVRYFLALSRLLDDLKIKTVLASEIFPQLNLSPGYSSIARSSQDIMTILPDVIVSVGKQSVSVMSKRMRLSQAVIIHNGMVAEVEAEGTNHLLQLYAKKKIKGKMPFLLKLPSVEFNPALDQPTIGPTTIRYCAAAGVRGIIVCAESTTIVQKAATIQCINDCGMFLYALPLSVVRQIYVQNFPNTWMRSVSIGERLPWESSPPPTSA